MPHYTIGRCEARALSATLGEPGSKGNIPLVVEFEILTGPDTGQKITSWLYFTEGAAKRSIESLRYCGYDGDDLCAVTFPADSRVELDLADEEFNGKRHTRVKWINKIGPQVRRLSPEAAKTFAAKMRGMFLAVPRGRDDEEPPF